MDKKIIIAICILIIGGLYFVLNNNPKNNERINVSSNILFYSNTCPHCKNVEKFIAENNIKEKIDFQELEVGSVQENAKIFFQKAKICGIPEQEAGVPMFWNGKDCISGDEPIINYFKENLK